MKTLPPQWRSPMLRFLLLMALAAIGITSKASAQSGGILSSTKSSIPAGVTATLTFRLALPSDPGLITASPIVQRLVGSTWTGMGALHDDGAAGDAQAGDGIFTAQTQVNSAQLGAVSFRASTAYKGVLRRIFSNTLTISVVAPLGIGVDSGTQEIRIVQGLEQNVILTVDLHNEGQGNQRVVNQLVVTPAPGLSVRTDYPVGGWSSSSSKTFVLNERLTGAEVGGYTVVNTASIAGTTHSSASTLIVHVIPAGGDPRILSVGAAPDALPVGTDTPVLFTAHVIHFISLPATLQLIGPDGTEIGNLRDDGSNGDLEAGDGVFSAVLTVRLTGEGTYEFIAVGTFPGVPGTRQSEPFLLISTSLPTRPSASEQAEVAADPVTGVVVLCGEVLVKVDSRLTSDQIRAIASRVDAEVIGGVPGLALYQLRLPEHACSLEVIETAASLLTQDPGVLAAEANGVGGVSEMLPSDPDYGFQYAPRKIRADETWMIARGGPIIAVLDTGVADEHPDLVGKVIRGYDFINLDSDPMDDHGHGTHVAGIAAAHGNNGVGVAGIAWNSPLLAVKVLDSTGNGSWAAIANGIKYAADVGAKVINLSLTGVDGAGVLEDAVNYAASKGALVVAASGNDGANVVRYPGAYTNAYCVGSTTSSDARSAFSNFGSHVDIAAPGSSIWSTLRTGGYGSMSGTSMAAPCVSGAAAVVWAHFPAYSAAQVRDRLSRTAVPLPGLGLGSGRIDLFEAVFNGSFEDGIKGWTAVGSAAAIAGLGPLAATDRARFAFASSGPDTTRIQTSLEQRFTIQPGVSAFKLSFDYNFVTEEFPEFVGTVYNDTMRILLVAPDGSSTVLATESVNSSTFGAVGGIDFPGGDLTSGHTGWKSVSRTIPVTHGAGNYRIMVRDEGDGIYDSNVLIDRIRFR